MLIIDKEIWFRFNMIIINEILSLVNELNKQLKDIIKLYIELFSLGITFLRLI